MQSLDERCAYCGLSLGSHCAKPDREVLNACPGHEGYMDFAAGPGTRFMHSGLILPVSYGTPAKNLTEGN